MPDTKQKFYVTTPIYYVNARPHIGHAYTTIAADVIARRQRLLLGHENVWFLTGTDEHGQKIERSAVAAGIPPQQFADQVSAQFEGRIIDLIESGEFCVEPEARRNEVLSFLRGNLVGAAGMMSVGDPGTLEQGLSFAEVNEGLLRGKLKRSNAGFLYVPGALKDLSISRSSFDWGIPVPEPAASTSKEKHVIYVWLDALANYMTAVGYGSDKPDDQARLAKFWPADLHLVGKEIIRFHCIYWPAFLLAADLPLPKKVQAHGWLLFEESKMSKSRGNIVRTETILEAFGSLKPEASKTEQYLFGADVLRYFLLREIPFGQDGSFSFDALVTRYNADLANGYGNLVSRTLTMINKYFGGLLSSVPTIQIIDKSLSPDWWTSDPFATEATFNEDLISNPAQAQQLVAIRDARKQVGMAIDAEAKVSGGRYFYA